MDHITVFTLFTVFTRGSAEPLVTWNFYHSLLDYVVHGPYGSMHLYKNIHKIALRVYIILQHLKSRVSA